MATLYQKIPMKNLIEKVKKWTCKARELMDKDVEVIQLEQLKEEIASAREELERFFREENLMCKCSKLGMMCSQCRAINKINEVLGEEMKMKYQFWNSKKIIGFRIGKYNFSINRIILESNKLEPVLDSFMDGDKKCQRQELN